MALQTNQGDATCLTNSAESRQFQQFINTCTTSKDRAIANTFISNMIEKSINLFETYQAQFNDLMFSADGLSTSSVMPELNTQIHGLNKQKEKLKHEIEHYRKLSGTSDKAFLEDIYNGTPKEELIPSMQDVSLILFWFGWLVISIVLVSVRWFSPGGDWKAGLFTLSIILLVTLCIYAILVQVA
jgi:hypothetical protein